MPENGGYIMEAILLDVDGTLWDSTKVVALAWNEVLKDKPNVNIEITSDKLKSLFGRPLPEIASMIFGHLPREEQLELIDECCQKEHEFLEQRPGIIFEGVVETIKELSQKYKICIVSNCEAGYIELVMDSLGIKDYITDFTCPGYTNLPKGPNCKLILERNHLKNAVYVGDTQGDCEAAHFAGIPFVFCEYGFGHPDRYDYSIKKFSELLSLF